MTMSSNTLIQRTLLLVLLADCAAASNIHAGRPKWTSWVGLSIALVFAILLVGSILLAWLAGSIQYLFDSFHALRARKVERVWFGSEDFV